MPVCVENADDIANGSVIGGGGGFGFGAGFCGSTTACLGTKAVEKSGVSNWTRVEIAGPRVAEFRAALVLDLEGALSRFHGLLQGLQALGELGPQTLRHRALVTPPRPRRLIGVALHGPQGAVGPGAVALGGLRRGVKTIRAGVVLAPGGRPQIRESSIDFRQLRVHLIRAARGQRRVQRRQRGLCRRADAEASPRQAAGAAELEEAVRHGLRLPAGCARARSDQAMIDLAVKAAVRGVGRSTIFSS